MRIIVVEDEYMEARDLERTLCMAGHTVVGLASTRDRASELARTRKPDLALVDVRLADGDTGPDVARELWEHLQVPSLFVTAHADDRPGYTDAALGILAKPVSRTALLRSVRVVGRIVRGQPVRGKDVPADLRLFVSL